MKKSFAALVLALCLTPGIASAEIQVNGVTATKNAYKEIYISENNAVITGSDTDATLLVVNNVSEVTFQNVSITSPKYSAALCMPGAGTEMITLNFEGTNTFIGTNGHDGINSGRNITINLVDGAEVTAKSASSPDTYCGGHGALLGSLTIEGKGKLTALGGDCNVLDEGGYEQAGSGLIIDSLHIGKDVIVIAKAGDAHCEGAKHSGDGIFAYEDAKVEGTVTAAGSNGTIYSSDGMFVGGKCLVAEKASICATGGNGMGGGGNGMFVSGECIVAKNASVKATGGNGAENGGDGVYVGGTLDISGKVEATGGNGKEDGGDGAYVYGGMNISGTVTVTGGHGEVVGGRGLYAYQMLKIGGTLKATGGSGEIEGNDGVYSGKLMEVTGTLTTEGGNGKELGGDGIDGRGKMIIGGDVTAKGGAGENTGGNGMEIEKDGAKIVLNGKLRAEGGSGAVAGVGLSNVDGETVVSGDVMIVSGGDGVAAIDSKSLTLDGVFGGESRDGKEWWDTIKSTMRYFASFTQRQKVMALPQTGDTSSLGLWLALLGMAGAGALMMRKRVHN